jgi:hypothetical protein
MTVKGGGCGIIAEKQVAKIVSLAPAILAAIPLVTKAIVVSPELL